MIRGYKGKESREQIIRRCYDDIMNRYGMEQVKEVVRHWEQLRQNLLKYPTDKPVLLPEYLWLSKSGTGKTAMLHCIAEYLDVAGLMPFNGMEKVIEFKLEYCDEEKNFDQLDDLIQYLSACTGYHNEYKGILAVNLDNWLPHLDNPHFLQFLEFISEHNTSLLLILIAYPEEQYLEQLEKILSLYLRVHKVEIPMPEVDEMYDFVTEKLNDYHCTLDADSRVIMLETLEGLRELEGFDGYKTLEFMVQEIMYNFYCKPDISDRVVTADILTGYGKYGSFIESHKRRYGRKEKLRVAGFHV